MAQTNINIRIDEKLKQQFEYICSELGLNMSTAFNMFAKAMVRKNGIPFEVSLKTPNAETLKAIEDVNNHRNLIGPFKSAKEAIEAMLKDEK